MGKSTLLTNLAGVYSEVAAYEFTTLTTVPGVIRYKGAKIQVSLVHCPVQHRFSVILEPPENSTDYRWCTVIGAHCVGKTQPR